MESQSFEHCNFDTSCAMKYFALLIFNLQTEDLQKQPFRDVLRKKCSENMQQIYKATFEKQRLDLKVSPKP